jgi:hypothetical protein
MGIPTSTEPKQNAEEARHRATSEPNSSELPETQADVGRSGMIDKPMWTGEA